ncbi:MAG: HNH endonuclease [Chitinophagales bacterium]
MRRKAIPLKIKLLVRERAKGYCEYCLASSSFATDFFPIEHIIPDSLGGNSHPQNLALSCSRCNGHKYNKINGFDPLTNQEVKLFNPRKDDWQSHFQWNEDETMMLGITPTGRATIDLLNINRENNINLRSLLRLVGLHPPEEYPSK